MSIDSFLEGEEDRARMLNRLQTCARAVLIAQKENGDIAVSYHNQTRGDFAYASAVLQKEVTKMLMESEDE